MKQQCYICLTNELKINMCIGPTAELFFEVDAIFTQQGENTVVENGNNSGRNQYFVQYGYGPYFKPVHIGSLSPTSAQRE